MQHAAIIGGGEIGRAIKTLAIAAGNGARIYDIDPARADSDRTDILSRAAAVFVCVPSRALPAVLSWLPAATAIGIPIIALTKGVGDDGLLPVEALGNVFDPARIGFLGGPLLAEEIQKGLPVRGIIAGASAIRTATRGLLASPRCGIEESGDVVGASACGVLKNIYAVLVGIAAALGLGDNARGALIAGIVREMEMITEHLGGEPATARGLAGIGDLVATSSSQYSRHVTAAAALVRGEMRADTEGIASVTPLMRRLEDAYTDAAFLRTLHAIIEDVASASKLIREHVVG